MEPKKFFEKLLEHHVEISDKDQQVQNFFDEFAKIKGGLIEDELSETISKDTIKEIKKFIEDKIKIKGVIKKEDIQRFINAHSDRKGKGSDAILIDKIRADHNGNIIFKGFGMVGDHYEMVLVREDVKHLWKFLLSLKKEIKIAA